MSSDDPARPRRPYAWRVEQIDDHTYVFLDARGAVVATVHSPNREAVELMAVAPDYHHRIVRAILALQRSVAPATLLADLLDSQRKLLGLPPLTRPFRPRLRPMPPPADAPEGADDEHRAGR